MLEIGGSKGYSTIWLASAAALRSGSVLSLEVDPCKAAAWRENVAEAGLEDSARLVEDDAFAALPRLEGGFDLCFLDAEKEDYELLHSLFRSKLRVGSAIVADNVLSHAETLASYSLARQADASLVSVTVPLDRGLELSVVAA